MQMEIRIEYKYSHRLHKIKTDEDIFNSLRYSA